MQYFISTKKLYRPYFLKRYTKNGPTYSESLRFPDGEKMAQSYCSAICQLSEICENFMTVKKTKCHRCMGIEDKCK